MNHIFAGKDFRHCLTIIMFAVFFATSSFGAVLNPFPTRDRAPQYQQSYPRQRPVQSPGELEKFRQDIVKFQCPDLQGLQVHLQNQYDTALSIADKEYYNYFLNALSREMKNKNCTN